MPACDVSVTCNALMTQSINAYLSYLDSSGLQCMVVPL